MIKLQSHEQTALSRYIYSLCAVVLDESKGYLIENRLGSLVEENGCGSFSQFLQRAQMDNQGVLNRRIIDAITTGETLFFRDSAPFDLLRHKILPELLERRARARSRVPIRIWSAACSTGQEIYSVAILARELLGESCFEQVRLLATDISDQAVARASKGHYGPAEITRGLDDHLRARYFTPAGREWQLRDEIRALVSFKRVNLMEDFSSLGRFDVVLCRNVAIYFSEHDRISLFGRLERALEPDGYLLIGALESLSGICPQFESQRHLRTVFYQLKKSR